MAKTIDQLNYKVILEDKDFDARIKADLKLAKDFNVQMSQLLEIKSKASAMDVKAVRNAEQIARAQQKTQEMLRREQSKTAADAVKAQEQIRREQNKTSSQAIINAEKERKAKAQTLTAQQRLLQAERQTSGNYGTQNRLLRELAGYGAAYFSVRTVERFISSLVRVSGEFELQHRTLQAIVGDIDAADKIFSQLQVLAVKSPFSFSQLTSYTKQLSAFSVPTEELYETTKMLADVSAGLGVDMGRIILAYGQIRSAAFLRGQEVRQLTEAGIPILTELAKQFTEIEGRMISAGEVFDKISLREVPFEMVEKVFKDMTSEGGKFYNMQEIQAETLKAKVKNLGDQYDIMLYQIGQAQEGLLKGSVGAIGGLMEHWQAIGRVIVSVAAGFGAYAGVLAMVWAREKAIMALDMVRSIVTATRATGSLTKGIKAYRDMMAQAGTTTKAAFAASIVGLIAAVTVGIIQLVRSASELNRELDKIADAKLSESSATIDGIDTLVKKLEAATEGSQNYRDAIHDLNSKYGEYLPNLITERDTLDEIKVAADAAAESIRNKAQASALAEGKEKIGEKYGKKLNESQFSIINTVRALIPSLTEKDAANIFALFKNILDSGETNAAVAIKRAIDAYANPGEEFWGRQNKYNTNNPLWGYADDYAKTMREWDKKIEEYNNKLGIVFSDYTPQSKYEQESISAIEAYYAEREQAIRRMQASEEEVNRMLKDLKVQRLENEILFYSGQGITLGDKEIAEGVRRSDIVKKKQAELARLTAKPTKGARIVQEALAKLGITERNKAWGLWADETTDFSADGYYKVLDEQYKDNAPNLKRAKERFLAIAGLPFEKADFDKLNEEAQAAYNDVKGYEKRRKAILAIADALGYDLGETKSKRSGSAEDPRLTALKQRRQQIEEIRKQYEAFKPFMNRQDDTTLKDNLFGKEGLFPEETDEALKSTLDFDAALLRVAADMEKYGEKGAEAARKIREDVALGAAKSKAEEMVQSWKDSAAALEKAQGILDKIAENIKDVNGESLQLKVNVIRDDLDRKKRKTEVEASAQRATILAGEKEYKELHRTEGDADKLWKAYSKNAIDAVNAWVKAENQANRDIAQDRIKELGKNFIPNWLKDKNSALNLDRIDEKSIGQINDLLDALAELTDEKILKLIDDDSMRKLGEAGLSYEKIKEAIAVARGEWEKMLDEKKFEKIKKLLNDIGDAAEKLGSAISGIGAELGDDDAWGKALSTVGSSISSVGVLVKGIGQVKEIGAMKDKSQAMAAGASMMIEGIASVLSVVGNQIAENKRMQEEWELAVLSTELAYRSLMLDKLGYKESNIFGVENPYKKAIDGVEQYKAAADELYATLDELAGGKVQTGTKKVYSGSNAAQGAAGGALAGMGTAALIGAAAGSAVGPIGTAIGAAAGAVVGGLIGLFGGKKRVPVYENLLDHYESLLDESEDAEPFALNPKIIADYEKLDDETKKIVDHWDEIQQKMTEAEEALNETITDFAGDMGSQLRDALVDAFRNGDIYSAIDTFHDYVTEVIEDLLAKAAFAAVFGDMFADLQNALHDSLYNEDSEYYGKNWEDIFAEFEDRLSTGYKKFNALMVAAQSWGKKNGYDLYVPDDDDTSGGSGSTVSGGIKSITEDTANLLASYINAIRADVSLMRAMDQQGMLDVQAIRALMPPPTVWEYIAKIEAHAFDISQSNVRIAECNASLLAELRSVITSEGGAPAIRSLVE